MRPAGVFCFLCLGLGLAVTAQAQNCSKPTGGPNMQLNFADSQKTTFADGSQATFVCDTGYVSSGGSLLITCTAGVWSSVKLECMRKNCGSPGEVENGFFDINGTLFGDKVVAICNPGFNVVGRNERTCTLQGWDGRVPYCQVVICYPPSKVVNASAPDPNKETYKYGEVIRYKCLSGHTLNGSSSISCSDDGKFTPAPPTCVKVHCKTPDIKNAYRDGGGAPPYGYKDFVTYQCNPGYTMIGEPSVMCTINSQWSPELPVCTAITNPTKATTTTTTTTRHSTAKTVPVPDHSSPPTDSPKNDGQPFWKSWWFILVCLGVCGAIAACCVWWLCFRDREANRRSKRCLPVDGPL